MNSIDLRTTRGIAVVALALALLAYAASRHPATGTGSPAEVSPATRSPQAGAAEAEMVETGLLSQIEAAMGTEFAGAWLDPSTARLEVGVTSPEAETVAEATAARIGLEDMVATTPVRSTWVELRAAQERWDRRLWDLLEAGLASTAAVPSLNTVEIELATAVGGARRAGIERDAAQDAVTAKVVHTPYRRIQVVPEAGRCNEFAPNAANCNPTIVGGVTIKPPKVGTSQPACTAGPAVLQKDRKKTPAATETYVLTAGHCIDPARNGGGVGAAWTAYDQAGKGETLGHATAYLHGPYDVGAISVSNETSYWADAKKNSPVEPAIAPWHKNKEHDPLSVVGQTKPAEKVETCLVGQSTGISCGKISNPSVTIKVGGVVMQQLVEVQGATSQGGDSGAPWVNGAKFFAEPPPNPVAYVEGTHVGSHESNPNRYFQSLEVSLAELKKAHGLDLELLTFFNENRHPGFKTTKYSAAVSGTDNSSAEEFTAFGSSVKCTERNFEGTLSERSPTLELTPTYTGCTSGGVWPVTFNNNGCKYRLRLEGTVATGHYDAAADIVCPEGKAGMELFIHSNHADKTAAKAMCTLTVPPQVGLETVTLTNSGSSVLVDGSALTGLDVKVKSTSCACPGEAVEAETGSGGLDLDGGLTLSATSMGEAVEFGIGTE